MHFWRIFVFLPNLTMIFGDYSLSGATACHRLPGLEKCPPLVVVSAGGGGVGASLRQTVVPFRANRANGANRANRANGTGV